MRSLVLRFGRPEERTALEDLQRRASLMHEAYREALIANPELIELPRWQLTEHRVRVAEDNGVPMGFSVMLPGKTAMLLDGLFVEPSAWKRGIGRALIEDAATLARQAGARKIEVIANPYAEGFYRRLGFLHIGTGLTALGVAAKMALSLET